MKLEDVLDYLKQYVDRKIDTLNSKIKDLFDEYKVKEVGSNINDVRNVNNHLNYIVNVSGNTDAVKIVSNNISYVTNVGSNLEPIKAVKYYISNIKH